MAEKSLKEKKSGEPGADRLAGARIVSAPILELVRLLARQTARNEFASNK